MDIKDLVKLDINKLIKNKTIIINFAIVLVTILVVRALFIQRSSQTNELRQTLAEEEKIEKYISELIALEGKIKNIQNEFYLDLDANEVVNEVSGVFKKHNISISSLTPESSIDQGLYVQFPLKLQLQTDFHSLGKLISDIENLKQVIYVTELKAVSASSPEAEKELLNVDLRVWGLALKK